MKRSTPPNRTLRPGVPRRSGIARRSCFIVRSYLPRSTNPPRHRSAKARRWQREWDVITAQAIEECGGECQARISPECAGVAVEGHHIRPKGRRGANTRANCCPTCRPCHNYIDHHKAEAAARGLLKTGRESVQ